MKLDIWTVIIIILLGAILFISIMNSCKKEPDLGLINQSFEQNKKDIEAIHNDIKEVMASIGETNKYIDSINQSTEKTIKRFSYEISKMEELFNNNSDTLIVNAVLRYWTDRLYQLPGFFQTTAPNL